MDGISGLICNFLQLIYILEILQTFLFILKIFPVDQIIVRGTILLNVYCTT